MSNEESQINPVILVNSPEEIIPEIERKVKEELPASFRKLPESEQRQTLRSVAHATISISQVTWDGNFPPPAMLEDFKRVDPSFGERIFSMAEKSLAHSQSLEKHSSAYASRGQIFGFILSLTAIAGSIFLIYSGKQISGSILGATVLIPLATLFVRGQIKTSETTSPSPSSQSKPDTSKKRDTNGPPKRPRGRR